MGINMELKAGMKVRMLHNCYCGQFKEGDVLTLLSSPDVEEKTWFCEEKIFETNECIYIGARDKFEIVKNEFQVGDVVEAFGLKGKVTAVKPEGESFFLSSDRLGVETLLEGGRRVYFTHEGKGYPWHKEPSLKLIERPVKELTFEDKVKDHNLGYGGYVVNSELTKFVGKEVTVTVKVKE